MHRGPVPSTPPGAAPVARTGTALPPLRPIGVAGRGGRVAGIRFLPEWHLIPKSYDSENDGDGSPARVGFTYRK
jgi:hypothetical protein